jgi:hypothetical protein
MVGIAGGLRRRSREIQRDLVAEPEPELH